MTKIETFRKLHQGPPILLLPNAWDVSSARIFEKAGFSAIATTSAGVANSLGYADVEKISRDEMIAVIKRIARAVSIPVTADLEAGYGDPVGTAQAAIDAGAVGMNFEDSLRAGTFTLVELSDQVRKIEQIRSKTDIVINARSDIYLFRVGDPATLFERLVERLNAYRQAGADSLFAPGVRDPETIRKLTQAVHGPVNILAGEGTPSISELEWLGVARVTIGSGAMRATMGLTQRIATELKDHGTYKSFTEGAMNYLDANHLFD